MGYSGLIYAAIVACWAAFLVPRWIRRNEEIERAREEDAARGVRVLERSRRPTVAHSGFHFAAPVGGHRGTTMPAPVGRPSAAVVDQRSGRGRAGQATSVLPTDDAVAGRDVVSDGSDAVGADAERAPRVRPEAGDSRSDAGAAAFRVAARRRRRVLTVLVLALAVVTAGVIAGRLPESAVVMPLLLLGCFLVLARRAAAAEARRRARLRQLARRRARQASQRAAEQAGSARRVAVLDEPEPVEPPDPNAWEPVPVPLPTYLKKAKAEAPVVRKIDLSSPGAWTSGRLNPASSIALPPPRPAQPGTESDLPEHRPAVGD